METFFSYNQLKARIPAAIWFLGLPRFATPIGQQETDVVVSRFVRSGESLDILR